jgi:hypothetical protein
MGAGSWGTTFGVLCHRSGEKVALWARDADLAQRMARTRRNDAYLPEAVLPDDLLVSADPEQVLAGADLAGFVTQSLAPGLGFVPVLRCADLEVAVGNTTTCVFDDADGEHEVVKL